MALGALPAPPGGGGGALLVGPPAPAGGAGRGTAAAPTSRAGDRGPARPGRRAGGEMVDEVLSDSGEATLKPAGVAVMRKVGAILKKSADRRVEVQGHTDNVPIRGALATRFPTNWELSAARSINVVRFLQDQAGLDPKLLYASASSEYRPRDTNDTDKGRRRNRRIEILLVPVSQPEGGGGR